MLDKLLVSGLVLLFTASEAMPADDAKFDPVTEFYKHYPCVVPNPMLAKVRANPMLVSHLLERSRPERDRFAAFYLLVNSESPGYRKVIARGLSDHSPRIREMAVQRLSLLYSDDQLVQNYIKHFGDSDEMVRYRAIEGLWNRPSTLALEPLLDCLSDDSIQVRGAASYALFTWDLPECRSRLRKKVKSSSVIVAGAASCALARWSDETVHISKIEPYLERQLKDSKRPPYHGAGYCIDMIRLLGRQKQESSIPVLREAAKHSHRHIREAAINALESIANSK